MRIPPSHRWGAAHLLLACLVCLPSAACDRPRPDADAGTKAPEKSGGSTLPSTEEPTPPLDLPRPAPLPATIRGQDVSQLAPETLLSRARTCNLLGDYSSAAAFQYQAVLKTGTEQYDLACYLARLGQADAAFYWLQFAALEDGVYADWADSDGDLTSLRADPRWPAVRRYLGQCAAYWAAHAKPLTTLTLPRGYDGQAQLAALVWLHGSNSHPDFRRSDGAAALAELADRLNLAVICVSGPVPFGKAKFNWSEDPERDYRRIRAALEEVADRVKVRPGSVIAIGFSQGAQVGLEVVARHPEDFAGAIAVSPGAAARGQLSRVSSSPRLAGRGVVIVSGSLDTPVRVRLAEEDARWFRGAGAKVQHLPYPGLGHSFPPDFARKCPEWVRFIEQAPK